MFDNWGLSIAGDFAASPRRSETSLPACRTALKTRQYRLTQNQPVFRKVDRHQDG
jgi:hypothetical protein